jgi:hypothetical protein
MKGRINFLIPILSTTIFWKRAYIFKFKKSILIATFFILKMTSVSSQEKLNINYACSYYGEKNPVSVYTFTSDNEAQSALKMITDAAGLSPNFKLVASNVPNAAAVIFNNQRYILYNQTFMYNISQRINYWASISILAHEVGHHLNGHSLTSGGSRPNLELEADKFSGFMLSKLGAGLDEAQSAINTLVSERGSLTHPGRSARLAAIASGWYQNSSSQSKSNSTFTKYNNRPSSINELSYIKLNDYIYESKNIQVLAGDYTFNPSEYKIINIDFKRYVQDDCLLKNPKTLVIYMIGYEKYYYVHNYQFDPVGLNINLKTLWNEANPYMYVGGKCFVEAYYKGLILKEEARIPIDIKYNPSGFTYGINNGNVAKNTFTNNLDLYRQPYGPGFKGLMIPEPAFLSPPTPMSNPY